MTEIALKSERKQLESKLLDLAFERVELSSASALLLSTLIVVALWSIVEHQRLLVWLGAMAIIQTLILLYARRYKSARVLESEHRKWRAGLVAGGVAAGFCWGSTVFSFPATPFNPETLLGIFVLPSSPFDPVTVLLMFILAGVAAYASVAMAFVPLFAMAFLACTLLPLSIWLLSFGEHMYVAMGLIAFSYFGVMVMLSHRMHVTVCSLISVSEENRGLKTAQQESDWRMQQFFESAPGFFYTACMTPDGKSSMPFVSVGIHELFDLAPGKVADSMSPMFALVHAEDIGRIVDAREASRKNLSRFHIEFRINHRIKGERWIELHSLPKREADGSTNWHGFMQDITKRKHLEKSLAGSERDFRTLAENFPDVVIRYDLDGCRTYVNRALAELAGTEPEEMLGKFLEDTPLVDPEAYTAELRRVIATRDAALLEVAARGTNREIFWYQARFVPEFDAANNVSGVLMVAGDITERKRMENEMRQQANFRETLFDAINEVGLQLMMIEGGRINYASNLKLSREFGYSEEEIAAGVPLMDIVHPDDHARVMDYYRRREAGEASPNCYELSLVTRSGERREYETSVAVLSGTGPMRIISVGKDITERKRMEEDFRLKEAVLDQARDGVYLIDEQARFIYVNDQACCALGYNREELLGMSIADIDCGASNKIAVDVHNKSLEEGAYSFETQHRRHDGSLFPVEIQASTLLYQGKYLGLALARDITERKRLDDTLRFIADPGNTTNFLVALARHLGEMLGVEYVIVDRLGDEPGVAETVALYANGAVVPNMRYALAGTPCANVMDKSSCCYPRGIQSLFPEDGLLVDMGVESYAGIPLWDSVGKPVGLIAVMSARPFADEAAIMQMLHIVSPRAAAELERAESEQRLRTSERDFRSLAGNMPDNIARWDAEGRYLYVNPVHERTLGAKAEDLIGTLIPDFHEQVMAAILQVAATGHAFHSVHQPVIVDGIEELHDVSLIPEFDETGKVISVLGVGRDMTNSYRMQETIAAREQELRALAESSPGMMGAFYLRPDGSICMPYVSPMIEKLFGLQPQDVLDDASPLLAMNHPDDAQRVADTIAESARNMTIWHEEYRIVHPSLGERWMESNTKPELHPEGGVVWYGYIHDITKRKEIENVLHRSQNSLAEAQRISKVGNWELDLVANNLIWSNEIFRIFEIDPKQFGASYEAFLNVIHPDDREAVNNAYAESLASRAPYMIEHRLLMDDGRVKFVQEHCETHYSEDGKPLRSLGTVQDVTERKTNENILSESFNKILELNTYLEENARNLEEQAVELEASQDQLKQTEEWYRSILHSAPDGMLVVDERGIIRQVNKQLVSMFGYTDAELMSSHIELLLPPALRETHVHKRTGILAGGIVGSPMAAVMDNLRGCRKDGSTFFIDVSLSRLPDIDGRVGAICASIRDISDRKQAELTLRASEEQAQSRSNLLNAIVESSPDVIVFALDTQYRYLSFNRKHKEVMQAIWGKEIAAGMSMLEVIGNHPDRAAAKSGFDRALSGESFVLEEAYGDELISRQYWQNYWSPIRAETGEVVGLTCFVMNISERKRIEETLRANEEKLGTLFALSPLGIAMADMQGNFVEFNEAFRAISGYPSDELMTLDYWTLTPRAYEVQEAEQLESLVKTGRYGPYEKEYRQKNGTLIPIQLNGMLVTGKDGQQYIWSIVEDISERKRAEKQLQQAVAFSEGIISAIPDILFEVDREGRYLNVWTQNPELLAAQKEQLLGNTFSEILSPDAAEIAMSSIREAAETGLSFGKVICIDLPNGLSWFELSVSRKAGDDSSGFRFLMLSRDVTARKLAEDLLRESIERITELNQYLEENARNLEEQAVELEASQDQLKQTEEWYRSILLSAPDGMLVFDECGVIRQVNKQLLKMFGYTDGELQGSHIEMLLPPAVREHHVHQCADLVEDGIVASPMDGTVNNLRGCRKDGLEFPVDVSLSRLPDLDGRVGAICASIRDISERKAVETARENALAEAIRLAEMRSTFLSQMSHELRTPLNGILGFEQVLQMDSAINEGQRAKLRIIRESGEHLLALVNQILDYAKIEADKLELNLDEMQLDDFLDAVVGIIGVRAEQKKLAFVYEADGDLSGVVLGDELRLRQVLLNLLANAIKFTDSGEVSLRVSMPAPSRMCFEVRDSGIGIAESQWEAIFQPFEQLGDASRIAQGTGLGLAISRKLVQLMGGDIKVESQPGAGSLFYFEIEMETVRSGAVKLNADALPKQAATSVSPVAPHIVAPPQQELDILHGLAMRGNMRDIMQHATRLAELDESYVPFSNYVCQLCKGFQTKALMSLIAQYRNEKEIE